MKVLHTYTCQAMSSRGARKGDTRTVAAGSEADKALANDPSWERTSIEELDNKAPKDSEAMLALERARAALADGRRADCLSEIGRATKLLQVKDRDSSLVAEKEREAAGKKAQAEQREAVKAAMEKPVSDEPEWLSKTQITQANKPDLLKALRAVGSYEPGMEQKKNDELRDLLRDVYAQGAEGTEPTDSTEPGESEE